MLDVMFRKDGAGVKVTCEQQELSSPPKPCSAGAVSMQDCPLDPKPFPGNARGSARE